MFIPAVEARGKDRAGETARVPATVPRGGNCCFTETVTQQQSTIIAKSQNLQNTCELRKFYNDS